MSIASIYRIGIDFSGDYVANLTFPSASNSLSPGVINIYSLISGINTITLPTGGSTVTGAIIIPPAGNTQTITLKGNSADIGVALSKVNPTLVPFDTTPPVSIVLTTGGIITGLKIIWV